MTETNFTEMDEEELEVAAREQGWYPPEENKGDAPKGGFKTAFEFLQKGEEILPIVRAQNKKLKTRLDKAEKDIKEISATSKEANAFLQKQVDKERRENKALLENLEQSRANAITEGDGQAAVGLERQIAELRAQPQSNPMADSLISAWRSDNEWYDKNDVMRDWANGYSRSLADQGVAPGVPRLTRVAEQARKLFPSAFSSGTTEEAGPGDLGGGGRRSGGPVGRKGFDDLPDEAQESYHRMKKLIPKFSKKQFLTEYDWEE
jgi:hypothetical protein